MERKLEGTEYAYVLDNDPISLDDILSSDIGCAGEWGNYYVVMLKSDSPYNNQVYFINKNTKKIEWGYFTVCIEVIQEATAITPKDLKRALS